MNVVLPIRPVPGEIKVTHRIVAYERATDRIAVEFDVPRFLDTLAFKVAEVDEDDQIAAFSYALNERQITTFAFLLGIRNDPDHFEYFLEPGGPQPSDKSPERLEAVAVFESLAPRGAGRSRRTARITERELTIPTLRILETSDRPWILTSDLIERLTELFRPTGTDAAILAGRSDTYFSQKVRNMISHRHERHSFINQGLAEYSEVRSGLRITDVGRSLIGRLRY